jgi:serine/threonine protein kinase
MALSLSSPPARVERRIVPSHIEWVPKIEVIEGDEIKYNVTRVTYQGRRCILKTHSSAYEDRLFPAELRAYTVHGLAGPHFVEFIGYLTDVDDKVDGMLLGFCPNFDIRWYLRKGKPYNWVLKMKWSAQIAHGLMEIHKHGIVHGDLRCENVVLDDELNAKIIDVVNGTGCMEGWCPWARHEAESIYEPAWDVYSLGVTLWEIIMNGATPPEDQNPDFEMLDLSERESVDLVAVARKCIKADPRSRPTVEEIHTELGGLDRCGCSTS